MEAFIIKHDKQNTCKYPRVGNSYVMYGIVTPSTMIQPLNYFYVYFQQYRKCLY